ncbi:MAG: hypothetical protein EON54_06070, partial [Alcaligenaceae bacterium]
MLAHHHFKQGDGAGQHRLMFHRTLLFSAALLAGCSDTAEPVHVWISSDEYKAGTVKSPLATPVVDEVIRQNPKVVQISMCGPHTAPKVHQFSTELRARFDPQMTAGFYEVCPGKKVTSPPPAPQVFRF